ncbi:uncharacterized protein METZ01_LOCUS356893, partial [marine metagenome]
IRLIVHYFLAITAFSELIPTQCIQQNLGQFSQRQPPPQTRWLANNYL